MPSITTHALSSDFPRETVTISVDPLTVDPEQTGKNGFWKIMINSVTWSGTNLGSDKKVLIDIRPPQFNKQNDKALIDKKEFASDALSASCDSNFHMVSLMQGKAGPSALLQGDGTYDLLNVTVDIGSYNEISDFELTVDYIIDFQEIDAYAVSTYTSDSIVLHCDSEQPADTCVISVTTGALDGVYIFVAQSLETSVNDTNSDPNNTTNFFVDNTPTYGGSQENRTLIDQSIPQSAIHTKNYPYKTHTFVYAINGGKIDANGSKININCDGSQSTQFVLANAVLYRYNLADGDTVDATLNYKYKYIPAYGVE